MSVGVAFELVVFDVHVQEVERRGCFEPRGGELHVLQNHLTKFRVDGNAVALVILAHKPHREVREPGIFLGASPETHQLLTLFQIFLFADHVKCFLGFPRLVIKVFRLGSVVPNGPIVHSHFEGCPFLMMTGPVEESVSAPGGFLGVSVSGTEVHKAGVSGIRSLKCTEFGPIAHST